MRYGDNDQLAARVAQITSSNLLIILSDVDGLYTSNPKKSSDALLIKYIKRITKSIEKQAENTSSSIAVGGMKTKIKAAKIALAAGCNMIITRGNKLQPISSIMQKANFSLFLTDTSPKTARKKWISSQMIIKGNITIESRQTSSNAYSMKKVSFEENKTFNKSNVERFINFHKKKLR